jgi:hypothetical protein
MCRFLTGPARIQQTKKRRIWKLFDNELYKGNDGCIYIVPRSMLTDNYTIPLIVAFIAGSPVDFDTRASHLHDLACFGHAVIEVTLKEHELRDKGFLRYSDKNKMWVCEDIPKEYLRIRKVGKFEANNLLYECMEASWVPLISRIIIRIGVCFNFSFYLDSLFKRVLDFDLDKIYEEDYWENNVYVK